MERHAIPDVFRPNKYQSVDDGTKESTGEVTHVEYPKQYRHHHNDGYLCAAAAEG
jgi:hypothetical protein